MSIAINDNFARDQYVAYAGQVNFVYTFPIYSQTYLTVYQRGMNEEPDDTTQILTLGADYTVTGVGAEAGGTIILVVPATVGDIITIVGTQPVQRESVFSDLNAFTVAMNQQLNQLTIMLQQNLTYWENLSPHYNFDELVSAPIGADPGVRPFKLILPMLPDGHVWVGRGQLGSIPDDITTAELPTSGGGGGGTSEEISQPGHTFVKGNWVRVDITLEEYVLAQSDNEENAEVIGLVVESDIPNGVFTVQQSGYVSSLMNVFAGLDIGVPQYLSPTIAGDMQNTDVVIEGQVSRAVFIADQHDSGWILPYRGFIQNGSIISNIAGDENASPYIFLGRLDNNSPDGPYEDANIFTNNGGPFKSYFMTFNPNISNGHGLSATGPNPITIGFQFAAGGVFYTGTNYQASLSGVNNSAGLGVPTLWGYIEDSSSPTNSAIIFPNIPGETGTRVAISSANFTLIDNAFGNGMNIMVQCYCTDWSVGNVPSNHNFTSSGYSAGQNGGGAGVFTSGIKLHFGGVGAAIFDGTEGYFSIYGIPNS